MTVDAVPGTGELNDLNEPAEPIEGEPAESTEPVEPEPSDDPAEGLKKALAAERKLRKEKERELRAAIEEREHANLEPDEKALAEARREAAAEATSAANKRILRSEVRVIAKGRLADPADALVYLDLDDFEVGDDGEIDSEAIEDAISDLLKRKPYLAADTGEKFRGSADQGARGKQAKASQLSKADIEKLSPSELMKAYQEGRVDSLIGRKP